MKLTTILSTALLVILMGGCTTPKATHPWKTEDPQSTKEVCESVEHEAHKMNEWVRKMANAEEAGVVSAYDVVFCKPAMFEYRGFGVVNFRNSVKGLKDSTFQETDILFEVGKTSDGWILLDTKILQSTLMPGLDDEDEDDETGSEPNIKDETEKSSNSVMTL